MKTLLVALLACLAGLAHGQSPPPGVLRALHTAEIPVGSVAIVVWPIEAERPLVRHRGEAPMNPASLMKLVTTLAALEILGPAHVWRTEALAAAPIEGGVLKGDLFLRGSGDPKFTHERLWLLLRELRKRGLREIRGDLVLDRSAFAPVAHDPAAFDGKPLRPYNVGPDALLFNFATVHLTLVPENDGVRVLADPLPAGMEIDNRLRAVESRACPADWRDRLMAEVSMQRIGLAGDYPRGCGEKRWDLAGLPNGQLLHGVFTRLWQELGGSFAGRLREQTAPPMATVLAVGESPSLGELVRDMNKYSNNVMTRQLFLTIGAGEAAAADQAVRAWLAQKGLDFPELVLDNGSGLSRRERISADSLTRLLAAAWASPVMPELMASLPIIARDGTARKRYSGVPYAGQAHLKTGSLEGVRGIAGYLLDRRGKRHIVVFMVNHANAAQAQPAFDALLEWLWQGAV